MKVDVVEFEMRLILDGIDALKAQLSRYVSRSSLLPVKEAYKQEWAKCVELETKLRSAK